MKMTYLLFYYYQQRLQQVHQVDVAGEMIIFKSQTATHCCWLRDKKKLLKNYVTQLKNVYAKHVQCPSQ